MITDLLLDTESAALVVTYGVLPLWRRIARRPERSSGARPVADSQPTVLPPLQPEVSVNEAATSALGSMNDTAERALQIAPGASDAINAIVELTRERIISAALASQGRQI